VVLAVSKCRSSVSTELSPVDSPHILMQIIIIILSCYFFIYLMTLVGLLECVCACIMWFEVTAADVVA